MCRTLSQLHKSNRNPRVLRTIQSIHSLRWRIPSLQKMMPSQGWERELSVPTTPALRSCLFCHSATLPLCHLLLTQGRAMMIRMKRSSFTAHLLAAASEEICFTAKGGSSSLHGRVASSCTAAARYAWYAVISRGSVHRRSNWSTTNWHVNDLTGYSTSQLSPTFSKSLPCDRDSVVALGSSSGRGPGEVAKQLFGHKKSQLTSDMTTRPQDGFLHTLDSGMRWDSHPSNLFLEMTKDDLVAAQLTPNRVYNDVSYTPAEENPKTGICSLPLA